MLAYMVKPKQENKFVEYGQGFASRLRNALGTMKQSELVRLLTEYGVELDAGRVSHYFTGRNYPDPPILAALCRALGVSADWVLGLTKEELPVADLEERLAAATGEGKINKIMRGMNKQKQQQVLTFAEYLLSREAEPRNQVPKISPLPPSERQRNLAMIRARLDSVEKDYGIDGRREMERSIREELTGDDSGE